MENDDKRVRKNRKISKDTESDRSRIKNITNKVHPEYEVPKKRPARGANRNRHSDWSQRAW